MDKADELRQAIASLEKQRHLLGSAAVDTALAALRKELAAQEQAALSAHKLDGERKLITVLFADLSGFTALSEKLDAELVRRTVNAVFEKLAAVIGRYQGFIEKYIGDEIMAMFGAPVSYEDHAERALNAALEMMEALVEFNRNNHTELGLHMGINSGVVVTGIIGAREHQQYGVTGDMVNLAARLKQASETGEIFVGPETRRLVQHLFDFRDLPPVHFKGKSEPVAIYQLLKRKEERAGRWHGKLYSNLVGREEEMNAWNAILENLAAGRGGVLAVIGEAGMGKSRLIAEMRRRTAGFDWFEGKALSYTRHNSYLPLREILSAMIGVRPGDDPHHIRTALQKEWEENCDGESPSHFVFLAYLLQVPLREEEQDSFRYLATDVTRTKIHTACQTYLRARARRRGLILVWEDLHWTDEESLALAESLFELCSRASILILLTFRPVREEPCWSLHERLSTQHPSVYQFWILEPLNRQKSGQLVMNLAQAQELSQAVEEQIFAKTEGNPFFIEELIRTLAEKNFLHLEARSVLTADSLEQIQLPGTLQGVIASRIDQLPEKSKIILQTAAVLGRIFNRQILERMLPSYPAMEDALQGLLQRALIRPKDSDMESADALIFKHAYTHEVAYQSLLLVNRERLHATAGGIYEEIAVERQSVDEDAADIAYHYERTPQRSKAIHYLKTAADRARQKLLNEDAIHYYMRALQVLEALSSEEGASIEYLPLHCALLEDLADLQKLTGRLLPAIASYRKAQSQLHVEQDIIRARLFRKTGLCYQSLHQFDAALNELSQARVMISRVQDTSDSGWRGECVELQLDQLFVYYWMNRIEEMDIILRQSFQNIQDYGNPGQLGRFYQSLILFRFRKESYFISEQTLSHAERMMAYSREADQLTVLSFSSFLYGFVLLWHNDLEESLTALGEALELARRMSDNANLMRAASYLAVAARQLNDMEKTAHYLDLLPLPAGPTAGIVNVYAGLAHANRAWLAWKAGKHAEALRHGREAAGYWATLEQTGLTSLMPFKWTNVWPLIAVHAQQKKWDACVEELSTLLLPEQKYVEPELEEWILRIQADYREERKDNLATDIQHVLELAAKLHYL
jgi:class 3 adenylate cyclase/tetratricopeptide (TPR) repeat protein